MLRGFTIRTIHKELSFFTCYARLFYRMNYNRRYVYILPQKCNRLQYIR